MGNIGDQYCLSLFLTLQLLLQHLHPLGQLDYRFLHPVHVYVLLCPHSGDRSFFCNFCCINNCNVPCLCIYNIRVTLVGQFSATYAQPSSFFLLTVCSSALWRSFLHDVETQILDQLEAAKDPSVGDVNLANLAPRKIDWDLKRDIAKKLEKLERRTQRAIVELIRDRLKEDSNDLASAVAIAGGGDNQKDTDEQNDSD
eukprot:Em0007g680a